MDKKLAAQNPQPSLPPPNISSRANNQLNVTREIAPSPNVTTTTAGMQNQPNAPYALSTMQNVKAVHGAKLELQTKVAGVRATSGQ
jgi:hypothetical protein